MLKNQWKSWKRNVKSYLIAYAGKYLIRCILWTSKVTLEGLDHFVSCADKENCILVLWHNRLAIISEILYRHAPQFFYTALVSKSRDGDPLTILAKSYRQGGTIRVPHNARHMALKKVMDRLKNHSEILIVTPDGPRGPRYEVKPGIAWVAQETHAAIVPLTWTSDKYWELNTWDRFRLPKFFSNINITFGAPYKIDCSNVEDRTRAQKAIAHSLEKIDYNLE